jgi:hypothetical protein
MMRFNFVLYFTLIRMDSNLYSLSWSRNFSSFMVTEVSLWCFIMKSRMHFSQIHLISSLLIWSRRPCRSSRGFFLIPVCEAISTAAIPALLCQPRVIVKMIVEKQMECRLAGEPKVLGENLPQVPLLSITKSHMTRPGFEPGPPRWEVGD